MLLGGAPAPATPIDLDTTGLATSAVDTPALAATGLPATSVGDDADDSGTSDGVDSASENTKPAVSGADAAALTSLLATAATTAQSTAAHAAGSSTAGDPASAAISNAGTTLAGLADVVRSLPGAEAADRGLERSIAVPMSDPNWSHAVAAQVQLLAAGNIQSATLRLSPEHLGPVEVHIEVQSAQVNVSFSAAHAETRAALEQSVPTLRALFAHSGLTLGQSSVHGETRSSSQSFNSRRQGLASAAAIPAATAAVASGHGMGLVDEYA